MDIESLRTEQATFKMKMPNNSEFVNNYAHDLRRNFDVHATAVADYTRNNPNADISEIKQFAYKTFMGSVRYDAIDPVVEEIYRRVKDEGNPSKVQK